jgi:hypothetical protein
MGLSKEEGGVVSIFLTIRSGEKVKEVKEIGERVRV